VTVEDSSNTYAQLLKEQGNYVVTVEGVDWYDYSSFMVPAYLPHCCPEITPKMATDVVRISGKPFARWDHGFGKTRHSPWWYVVRKGSWSLDQCSANTRSKVRRGRKHLYARQLAADEVLQFGYDVCLKAQKRYEKTGFVHPWQVYEKKIQAANQMKGVLEFFGVFSDDRLVAYSENYIQNKAAFWESIWYDPEFLPKYSSYVLIDAMLNNYLNDRKFAYVSDGCRSIYHRTYIQDYLSKFGFTKEYAILNVVYSCKFKAVINMAYPFRDILWFLSQHFISDFLDKTGAIIRQEYIRRACQKLKVL